MGVQSTDGEVEVVEFFCSGARGSIEGAEKQGFGSQTKAGLLQATVSTYDPDIIIGTETKIDSTIPTSEIFPQGITSPGKTAHWAVGASSWPPKTTSSSQRGTTWTPPVRPAGQKSSMVSVSV